VYRLPFRHHSFSADQGLRISRLVGVRQQGNERTRRGKERGEKKGKGKKKKKKVSRSSPFYSVFGHTTIVYAGSKNPNASARPRYKKRQEKWSGEREKEKKGEGRKKSKPESSMNCGSFTPRRLSSVCAHRRIGAAREKRLPVASGEGEEERGEKKKKKKKKFV